MILGDDGARLSKRHGAVSVMSYRDEGYLPEALLNYLVRLGWSHGDQELFSVEQMIELFDIKDVNKSASSFNTEKLLWLNQQYLKESSPEHIAKHLAWHLEQQNIDTSEGPELTKVIALQQERAKTLVEMAENSAFFYKEVEQYDEKAAKKHLLKSADVLKDMQQRLDAIEEWLAEPIHAAIKSCATDLELGMGKIAQPIRVAITGNTVSPSIDITLELVGKERTLSAIEKALVWISDHS
jgi:glutamyl-tRNA synthetase